MRKMEPAITDLYYTIPAGQSSSRSYIDTARSLSRCNRRLYSQSKMYAYQGLTFIWKQSAANPIATMEFQVRSAPNTWIVHNAFVKGKALWDEMQDLVLEDNPSVKGRWHDFKIRLRSGSLTYLDVQDGSKNAYVAGEWSQSTFVMPQHEVDPATGLPLPAQELTACLIGDDGTSTRSLVKAYEESRATVQPIDPNVPAGMSTSFFNLLTDSGSQEPELADVIEDENDEPPYDADAYPGAATNGPAPVIVGYGATSSAEVDGRIGPFVAPCGLLEVNLAAYDDTGAYIDPENYPEISVLLHVAPGMYKGVAAIDMGQ